LDILLTRQQTDTSLNGQPLTKRISKMQGYD